METINVKINASKEYSYPIIIGENLFSSPYEYIKKYTKANRYLVVTNTTVNSIYGKYFESEFADFIILPDGEEYKNQEILSQIIDKAVSLKLERKDAIIALGGGVIGDMAGFAASIYQRGIDFIQVPTTLLAQVDSSVGGKVAINHKYGKNLIGSFYQPKLVLADTNTLNTLDERQFKTGLSEVLKYAFIEKSCNASSDFYFLEFLEKNKNEIYKKSHTILNELIKICCTLKSSVVNQDEKEKGLRAILNLGHTYAHAIEMLTNYTHYTHGEAVSIGIKLVFELSQKLNLITDDYFDRAIKLLNEYNLLTESNIHFNKDAFYNAIKSDKKVSGGNINFVLPVGEKIVEIRNNIDRNSAIQGIK